MCYNETMRNNEAFKPTETTEIEKTQEALSRQEKKLVGFYASNGDERFVFDSNLSEFNENRVGEDEEKQAFNLIRRGGETCRKMERQLLHDISRSARFETDDKIFQSMEENKQQRRILGYMTGVEWNDIDKVSSKNLGDFLEKYPTPIDFEEDASYFLKMIQANNSNKKYDQYLGAMDSFCQTVYGKKYEYYKAMRSLKRKAEREVAQKEGVEEVAQEQDRRPSISSRLFGERHEREKAVFDAGVASLSKGNLLGKPGRENEDRAFCDLEGGVFGVFDGAGGERGAARASALAVEVMKEMVAEKKPKSTYELGNILKRANERLCKDDRGAGYSTGVVGAIVERWGKKTLCFATVGDSRIYLVRDGKAQQITEDEGVGNRLFNCLGNEECTVDQVGELQLRKGDRLVFCSDGVTGDFKDDAMSNDELARIVTRANSAKQAADNLTQNARKIDDRTAVVVEV